MPSLGEKIKKNRKSWHRGSVQNKSLSCFFFSFLFSLPRGWCFFCLFVELWTENRNKEANVILCFPRRRRGFRRGKPPLLFLPSSLSLSLTHTHTLYLCSGTFDFCSIAVLLSPSACKIISLILNLYVLQFIFTCIYDPCWPVYRFASL